MGDPMLPSGEPRVFSDKTGIVLLPSYAGEVASSHDDGGVGSDATGAHDPSGPYDGPPPLMTGEERVGSIHVGKTRRSRSYPPDDRDRAAARRPLMLGAAGDIEHRIADGTGQDAAH